MMMRHLFIHTLIAMFFVNSLAAAERDAVIQLDGCSGFIVDGNLLVTAKHCRHPDTMAVIVGKRAVTARKVYAHSGVDGPVVFRLDGGPYESLALAERLPEMGTKVYSLGYPGGHWARIEGEIVGGNGVDVNYTNHRIATGASGGPLLDSRGEVIGVALFVDSNLAVHRSGFAGWRVTTAAVHQVRKTKDSGPQRYRRRTVVVVFSSENCGPCRQLEQDVRAGHFADYEFQFVKWDARAQTWSQPQRYQEFAKACQPKRGSLTFPTIWVEGTNQYRVGYQAARRGGLLGWLTAAVRHLIEGIAGQEEPLSIPLPDSSPVPESEGYKKRPDSAIEQLVEDVAGLRDQAVRTKADLDEFRTSGVVGKIKAIARLKSDKGAALDQVGKVRNDVEAIRDDLREQPLQFLWGLFGLLSGLLQRRFAH
ncbi:MAG: trypsin-like serine protease [Planctomycetaceae bacterium]|jgi:hypothetical protein|nr:trypsin-like serine protease [Planctomycetaceae bacterium]MBT6485999.1 trypsin-like serine protease [Planctomycetaceae bacterium]